MNCVVDLKEYINYSVFKVMGVDYVGYIIEVCIELDGYFNNDIDVIMSKFFFLEFMVKNVLKGNVIKVFCKRL